MLFHAAVLVLACTAQLIGLMPANPLAKPGFDRHIHSLRGGCSTKILQVRNLAHTAGNLEVGMFTRGHTCKLLVIVETEIDLFGDVHGRPSGDLGLQEPSRLLWRPRGGGGFSMLMNDQ